jgi:hypothetical protein
MVPAQKGAAFEVVQPELALEFLVRGLGAPAFLDDAHDLLLAHVPEQRREEELRRLALAVGHSIMSHRLPIARIGAVVVGDLDTSEREAGGAFATRSYAPCEPPKGATTELDAEVLRAERSAVTAFELVEQSDLRARRDRDAEIQAEHPDRVSEPARGAIRGVDEHDVAWDLCPRRPA